MEQGIPQKAKGHSSHISRITFWHSTNLFETMIRSETNYRGFSLQISINIHKMFFVAFLNIFFLWFIFAKTCFSSPAQQEMKVDLGTLNIFKNNPNSRLRMTDDTHRWQMHNKQTLFLHDSISIFPCVSSKLLVKFSSCKFDWSPAQQIYIGWS